MATHSSILVWMEEPGRLQSMGCKESDTEWPSTHTLINKNVIEIMCIQLLFNVWALKKVAPHVDNLTEDNLGRNFATLLTGFYVFHPFM